jgi:hypothetical protein
VQGVPRLLAVRVLQQRERLVRRDPQSDGRAGTEAVEETEAMTSEPLHEKKGEWAPRLLPAVLIALAVYLLAYFPALSYGTRHPEFRGYSVIWRPLPRVVAQFMFRTWVRFDPAGYAILSELAARPREPQ